MAKHRSALFYGRHFRDEIILLCVRWDLRYSLSYRDLEEMMEERGLSVDHSTIARWLLRYAPVLNERLRRHVRRPAGSWRVDETYVRVNGRWTYLYRAVDSAGDTIDFLLSPKRDAVAAKLFLQLALRSGSRIRPRVINVDGHQAYAHAIAELKRNGELGHRCRYRRCPYLNNVVTAVSGSDHVMPLPGLCRILRSPCWFRWRRFRFCGEAVGIVRGFPETPEGCPSAESGRA